MFFVVFVSAGMWVMMLFLFDRQGSFDSIELFVVAAAVKGICDNKVDYCNDRKLGNWCT